MIEKKYTIENQLGLHARPAALFVQTAHKFESRIRVIKEGQEVDGKSIMGILTLAAEKGCELTIIFEGPDEEAAASKLAGMEMTAGHGSYGPSQIIVGPGRTVTFDWDGYDVADPARDVGRFLASLRRVALVKLGSARSLDAMVEIFFGAYLEVGQPEAVRNLRFYEAAACLRLAKHSFFHARLEKMEATLDEGLRILEQEPNDD